MNLLKSVRPEPGFYRYLLQMLDPWDFPKPKTKHKEIHHLRLWKTWKEPLFQPWFVNGKFLSSLTALGFPEPQRALESPVQLVISLWKHWLTALALEQWSPLRLGPRDGERSELCRNSPVQSKVAWLPRIHRDSGKDLESFLNDSLQSSGITHGFNFLQEDCGAMMTTGLGKARVVGKVLK